MAILTSGRTIPCKDNIGGIRNVFLFKYVSYTYNQIIGVRGESVTTFPATDIYEFAVTGASMSEDVKNDENGLSYNQTMSFVLKKQDWDITNDLHTLSKMEIRYIAEYNDGNYRIGGLFNGATLSFDSVSGTSKESLNGYNVTIESQEEWQSAYITSLSGVGFTVLHHLLMADGDDLLTEDRKKIILA